ncbi:hypothetical protein PsorP6_008090 [Peronosclerospora sorghi]|uniref:Uncharacterized protein n=1 Tax=Peronosclerospora sorghi TaxID=230839 RepID=A0ACC0W8V8_9STRA|nr:hypothetical protein PsorP6_008090 [Peronosclerospora sorghi]
MEGEPGGLPLDIAVKYGIWQLFERDFATAESMFTHLFAQDVRVFGYLYLEVSDAYIALGDQYREAAAILQQLLGREEFPIEQIWIKYAACHDRLGIYDVARLRTPAAGILTYLFMEFFNLVVETKTLTSAPVRAYELRVDFRTCSTSTMMKEGAWIA